jgi:hypothetical protein
MENTQDKNKRRKRAVIIAALIAIPGLLVAGVFASNTTITLNSGTPLSLGAGYTTATTCDDAVNVSATQVYDVNAFKVDSIKVTGIETAGCAGKTLTLVAVVNGTPQSATLSLVTPSVGATVYTWGQSSTPQLASFALDQLSTIAVGIS